MLCFLKPKKHPIDPKKIMFEAVYSDIRKKMISEEGLKFEVYLDSLGFPTVGIGHLVKPEDNLKIGDKITINQINDFFKNDITWAINAAIEQSIEVGEFEKDFVIALTSVNFQLGENWPSKWPNTYAALKVGNLQKVIRNINRSLWKKQTPKRVAAFEAALKQEISEKEVVSNTV
jgi:GH24 family phage-related lysozyme (muramidase)